MINNILKEFGDMFQLKSSNEYLNLIFLSILIFFIISLMKKLLENFYKTFYPDTMKRFKYNYKGQLVLSIIMVVALFIIWEEHISSLITIISFISAGATIALREIIFNFFAGIYIRVKKPFIIGDRIELNNIKGDVVSLDTLNFAVLEIGDRINGEQSSGIIVNFPNSLVLTSYVKNYVKEFKYIWNEITIKVPMNADIENIKQEIYNIINNNEILKKVPKKMQNQISDISLNYRIYFNKLEPIIYTKIVGNHIELYARYLVNPRKARYVEDELWNQIIMAYKEEKIELFLDI